ncbi:hypothetical protein M378DRAFT_27110 [Amanita muscaria Koide BX008]|uniref:Linoleate diol synthase n=1 Tax=Amanita muscaria (strain Koide BX008) TaxID=946122 RepID=A0A0C2WR20_AMAMK|nr:hypothetical protein M378DRAFT_27110 [Amanita muscaria Koide BX008]
MSSGTSSPPTTPGPFSTFASRFMFSPRTQQHFSTTPKMSPRSSPAPSLDSARRRAELPSLSDEEVTPTSPVMSSHKSVKIVVDEARSERSVRSTETASDTETPSRVVNSDNVPPASAPPTVQYSPRPYSTTRSNTSKSPDTLYSMIPNLPRTFLGSKHIYRDADGGYNNVLHPDVGRAGMPYTRNVRSEHRFSALPEPGLVFDTLLKARDKRVHPSGASSLAYAFAQLIAFSLYDTNFDDSDMNSTSSYLDLSPLYGSDEASQSQVRDKDSGRGLLFPDAFAEDRLALAPPAVCALLVIFNRNHNYIAERLFSINEQKKWIDPKHADEKLKAKQDEEIFQTARLVNCGHFLSVMVSDYLPAFLGLYEDGKWTKKGGFDLSQIRKRTVNDHQHGTHSSVEFNIVYRWNATLSQADLKCTEDAFNELVKRKSVDRVTAHELKCVAWQHRSLSAEPKRRGFANLIRGFDGRFDDDELAGVLLEATENGAGAFRPRGIPHVFRAAEMLAIDEARIWGVCSMNEFREFLGLRPFTSFEQWCSDPVISSIARRLYGHIDNLELYPGLQCETLYANSTYSCGYTMTKAILADAARIIKADRFFTTDFTPRNLTAWGYQDCQRDMSNSNQGGQLSRLLMRHLHRHYPYNSVYGCFPFLTPLKVKDNLTKQGIADRYTFERPAPAPVPKVLDDFVAIRHVVNNPDIFPPVWELKVIQDGAEYMLSVEAGAEYRIPEKISTLQEALFPNPGTLQTYGEWLRESISKKTKERSWKYAGIKGTTIDLVKDVVNATVIEWVAEFVLGIPLKTDTYPEGLYTESELYGILSNLYSIKYPGIEESENTFALRQSVRATHVILGLVAKEILALKRSLLPRAFVERITGSKRVEEDEKPSFELFNALASSNKPIHESVAIVLDIAISFSINVAEAVVHAVEFYLEEGQEKERHHMVELLQLDDAESGEVLLGYAREALRFHPRICNIWRGVTTDTQIPQGQEDLSPLNVHAGDMLWISFKNAYVDAAQFPEPYEIDPRRNRKDYRIHGSEFFSGPIAAFGEQLIVEVLRVILKLRNLRLADGDVGRMAGFRTILNETEMNVYLTPDGSTSCRPGPFHIVFDE